MIVDFDGPIRKARRSFSSTRGPTSPRGRTSRRQILPRGRSRDDRPEVMKLVVVPQNTAEDHSLDHRAPPPLPGRSHPLWTREPHAAGIDCNESRERRCSRLRRADRRHARHARRLGEPGPARVGRRPSPRTRSLGSVEVWEIHNFTEDAHPIHITRGAVPGRRSPVVRGRRPAVRESWETGFKDTVIAYPEEITRVEGAVRSAGAVRVALPHRRARGQRDDAALISSGPIRPRRSRRSAPAQSYTPSANQALPARSR